MAPIKFVVTKNIYMRYLPAEWNPQSAILIAWPNEHTDWNENLNEARECYKRLARAIAARQRLVILVHDEELVRAELGEIYNDNVTLVRADYNDTWTRDFGPITVYDKGKPIMLDFKFNGWGEKFDAALDNSVPGQLKESVFGNIPLEDHSSFVLEGGSIESDGLGTLLTTSHCLMAKNRNQPMTRGEIEAYLKKSLGACRVLWLDYGWLEGDDTDAHIDTLARFCNEHTLAYVKCENRDDKHFFDLSDMEEEIVKLRTADGSPYKLAPLPMPDAIYDPDGKRLPATYANFLIINDAVLLPFYNCPQDEVALQRLTTLFPDREVIGINCLPLIKQHGSLHCITMQIPEGI